MNRTGLCIRMLILLKSRDKISTKELAELLETNPRNIREFRKELEAAGYMIQETRGRNGGYSLDDHHLLPVPKLSTKEKQAIGALRDYVEANPHVLDSHEALSALDKVITVSTNNIPLSPYSVSYQKMKASGISAKLEEMVETAKEAMATHHVLRLCYQGRNRETPENVLVDPYHIVNVEDHFYLIGWSHTARDYRNYKFSEERMFSLEMTPKTFLFDGQFRLKDYVGSTSAFKGKVTTYLVAVRSKAERLFREEYWGTEFHLADQQKDWRIYSFIHDNPMQIENLLFSFGPDVILLEPEENRKQYEEKLRATLSLYQSNGKESSK